VLFDPEDRAEVEVRGKDYVLLRERDLHAVAAERLQDGKTGLSLPVSRASQNRVSCAISSYNESKCNVRELALLCQIASSVSTWHQGMGALSTTK
jgi:hypothetical protein